MLPLRRTGHGFSVVAEEVRKLAERSGGAAKAIASMISAVQAGYTGGCYCKPADGLRRSPSGNGDGAGKQTDHLLNWIRQFN